MTQLKSQSIFDLIKNYEVKTLTPKFRSAEANNDFADLKTKLSDTFVNQLKSKKGLRSFADKNISKIRSIIADASCETQICSGVVDLYKECNPDLFALMPNVMDIPCDGRKQIKIARKGRYTTFAPKKTWAALQTAGNFTDLTSSLDNDILKGCVLLTPEVVEGAYNIELNKEICGESDALRLICFTVDTLEQIVIHLAVSANNEVVKYLNTVATPLTPATGDLKQIFEDMIIQGNSAVGSFNSANKMFFVNPDIIERMVLAEHSQGMPLFRGLSLQCGSLFCDAYCWNGVGTFVVLPETILPKVTGKYQVILFKADQFDVATAPVQTFELAGDLAVLLNGMKSKVAGYKPFIFKELPEFAGKTTYKTLIS